MGRYAADMRCLCVFDLLQISLSDFSGKLVTGYRFASDLLRASFGQNTSTLLFCLKHFGSFAEG